MIFNKLKGKIDSINAKKALKTFFETTPSGKSNGKRVLIYAGIGNMYMSYFEVLVYHLLVREGYRVEYLIYDEHIKINELITKKVLDTQGKDAFWEKDVKKATSLLDAANVNYTFINAQKEEVASEFAKVGENLDAIFSYKKEGIALGEIVKGTMYRFYKSLTFDEKAGSIASKFLHTALTNYYEVKQRCEKNEYDFVLFSHGIYVTWEPVVEYCKANNVDFFAYDRAKTANTININVNQVAPDWSFDSAWERYKNKTLNNLEKEAVTKYLKDRELQVNDVYAYNFSERSKNIDSLKEELGIPLGAKVVTIFTNLIWDAANVARDLAFSSALECVFKTMETYGNKKNVHLILRSHPAEKVLGTHERYGDLVKAYFGNELPANITLIEPEMKINSFSVIDISDIGVVNTSTVGLEFALLGKPIILISETHYRNKGFTYDVNSKEAYFNTINELLVKPKLKENQVNLAEKYFYIMMFHYQHKIPLAYENGLFRKYLYKNIANIPKENIIYKIIDRMKNRDENDFVFWE